MRWDIGSVGKINVVLLKKSNKILPQPILKHVIRRTMIAEYD